ncbi:MAG: AI-2E family transporter [Actinomycetota bacterium]|nr:AI-2E family transporter [Actinomycetota bacterium]
MAKPAASERTVYVGIGLVFALLVGGYFIYEIGGVVLAFLLSVLFSIIFGAPVNYLARRGLPRAWGVLAIFAALVVVFWLFGLALAPAIAEQSRQLAEDLPVLLQEALALANRVRGFFGLDTPIGPDAESLSNVGRELLTGSAVSTAAGVGITVAAVGSLGLVVAISTIYLIIQPEPWVNGFVSLFPAGWRQRVRELLEMMYHTIQRWFLGQLAAMTFIGVFWAVALSIIGIPFALLLGILSGLISFVPYMGAIVSVVIPVVLALSSDPITAVWVVVAFVVIQQLEGNVLQPIVMSQAVNLHPALVVFALVVMGTLFGLVGIVLAVPLAAALQVLVRELWVKRMDRMGNDPNPPAQEPKKRDPPGFLGRAVRALRRSSRQNPAP